MMTISDNQGAQKLLDVTNLERLLKEFAQRRDWEKYHSPKNLAMALTGEVGELIELFQWLTEEESKRVMDDPQLATKVRHELADVLLYLIRLSSVLGVDMNAAVMEKLEINTRKYPVKIATSE